jgi:hypothetical protein
MIFAVSFCEIATMPITPVLLLAAALSQYPTITSPGQIECYDYGLFTDVMAKAGAKVTQTIETPSFPSFKRLFVVTYKGTKEIFGAYDRCVVVPPLFVDYPDGMDPIPMIQLLPPGSGGA